MAARECRGSRDRTTVRSEPAEPAAEDRALDALEDLLDGWEKSRREAEQTYVEFHDVTLAEQLRRVRTGAHVVRLAKEKGHSEVQLTVYKTGPTYGLWFLRYPGRRHNEDDNGPLWLDDDTVVEIEHYLPYEYDNGGAFMSSSPHRRWTVKVHYWRQDPVGCLSALVGKRLAAEVALLLPVPAARTAKRDQ